MSLRRNWLASLAALLLPIVSVSLTATGPAAATAAPMTCFNNGGAPSAQRYLGGVRYFYSHRCNLLPGGVDTMTEFLDLEKTNTVESVDDNKWTYKQTGVDLSTTYFNTLPPASYQPVMTLIIHGTFTYGSVPGCFRDAVPNQVVCVWRGQPITY